jgi:predicted enzyme related to lactoylglutathione lyase
MPERSGYKPGTPSWVDLSTPDLEGATQFYGDLFGWEAHEPGPVEETGGYRFFLSNGHKVAGVGPIMQQGQPPIWSTYFATDNVDELSVRVRDAGGSALMEPTDIADAGRMAFFAHPAGGMFGGWEARNHNGAELVNEPVSLSWNTLVTPDPDGAAEFLASVFGLRAETQDVGGGPFTILMLGEDGVGGVMGPPPGMPEGAPAFWGVSFAVADTDAAVAKAGEMGGSVLMEPVDMPAVGRIASLSDPYGATFSVVALSS